MARRKNKSVRRRRFTGINILDAAQTYAQASVWSEALFKVNPIEFITSKHAGRGASNKITLMELLDSIAGGAGGVHPATATAAGVSANAFGMIQSNLRGEWVEATVKSVGIGIGFKIAKKALAAPRRNLNKLTRNLGMGSMVKF